MKPLIHIDTTLHDEDRPRVRIYGNPTGLRELAGWLTRVADIDQQAEDFSSIDGSGEHEHLYPGEWISHDRSIELVVGRMDRADDGSTDRYERTTEVDYVELIRWMLKETRPKRKADGLFVGVYCDDDAI